LATVKAMRCCAEARVEKLARAGWPVTSSNILRFSGGTLKSNQPSFSRRQRGRAQSTHDPQISHIGIVESSEMRRALFLTMFAILTLDASGITSLIVPEACALETSDGTLDGGCPAFCVRCACPCCVSGVEQNIPIEIGAQLFIVPLMATSLEHLPTGIVRDILHIPKILLT
jgi:hypothetical protein